MPFSTLVPIQTENTLTMFLVDLLHLKTNAHILIAETWPVQ